MADTPFHKLLKQILDQTDPDDPRKPLKLNPRAGTRPRRVEDDVRPDQSTGLPGTRRRYALGEPDDLQKLEEEQDWLQQDETHGRGGSIIKKPARWKSVLSGILAGAGQAANQALASGNTGAGGLGAALGGGIAGGTAAGINPRIILKARHQQALEENQQDQAVELTRAKVKADIAHTQAESQSAKALAEWRRNQPKQDADAAKVRAFDQRIDSIRAQAISGKFKADDIAAAIRDAEKEFGMRSGLLTPSETEKPGFSLSPGQTRFDSKGNPVASVPATDKGEGNKREALLNLSSSLYKKADAADAEAARVEATLSGIPGHTFAGQQAMERAARQIDELRKEARTLRVQGDQARAEAEGIPVSSPKVQGKGFSISLWLADHPGANEQHARAFAAQHFPGVPVVK